MERNDVIEFKRNRQEVGEEKWEVVDADIHGYKSFDGKIFLLVEVEEVSKASLE